MYYSPEMTRDFLKLNLGPELEKSGYGPDKLKVMILDHNLSLVKEWVQKIFSDREASKYAHGTAIHWYGHDPKEMLDEPHNSHPDKFFLATEACQEGGVHLGDWKLADLYASDILGVRFCQILFHSNTSNQERECV
jgi:glucosylceramidase